VEKYHPHLFGQDLLPYFHDLRQTIVRCDARCNLL